MRFKNIFIALIVSLFMAGCSVNEVLQDKIVIKKEKPLLRPKVNNELLKNIEYIIFLIKQNDLEILNTRYIHPKFKYYELRKEEDSKKIIIEKKSQIDEINNDIYSSKISQEEVSFNCSPYDDAYYGWNKEGVFLSYNEKLNFSSFMKEKNLITLNRFTKEEIKEANIIEKTSYKITIPYNMSFYLTKIDKRWYITIIDKVKTDCSNKIK